MLIKVCGMRLEEQIRELDEIVDFLGFIFYEKSKRFVQSTPNVERAQKVGVFVNATIDQMRSEVREHSLQTAQLHGNETPEMCARLKDDVKVIKAFGVNEDFNFDQTKAYSDHVDYFLFDTKTPQHGGSGKQFDWSLLSQYEGSTPFLLSGGINPESLDLIQGISHPKLAGLDLNSGFERAPADKNIQELKQFIKELQQ
ncbi:MAG: phosphoribosylanthranilate isomerase [Crocinitomicaceae bacterium]